MSTNLAGEAACGRGRGGPLGADLDDGLTTHVHPWHPGHPRVIVGADGEDDGSDDYRSHHDAHRDEPAHPAGSRGRTPLVFAVQIFVHVGGFYGTLS